MEDNKCWATRKIAHRSRKRAVKHLVQLRKFKQYSGKPYVCPFCNKWHVGRPSA